MTVWLRREALADILGQGRALAPLEAGGVLLGWRDGRDRIVSRVTGAGPRALHGRFDLVPDHAWQVEQIHQAFQQSGGDLDYLGDWHTHPNGAARMSPQDERTLFRIGRRAREALMVIAVPDPQRRVAAWMEVDKRWPWHGRIEGQAVRIFDAPGEWPR